MKVELKKGIKVDVIIHKDYNWLLTSPDTEKMLGVGRSVPESKRRTYPKRYLYGTHCIRLADISGYLMDYDIEFITYEHRILWTRKGLLELSQHCRNVRDDFYKLIERLDNNVNVLKKELQVKEYKKQAMKKQEIIDLLLKAVSKLHDAEIDTEAEFYSERVAKDMSKIRKQLINLSDDVLNLG